MTRNRFGLALVVGALASLGAGCARTPEEAADDPGEGDDPGDEQGGSGGAPASGGSTGASGGQSGGAMGGRGGVPGSGGSGSGGMTGRGGQGGTGGSVMGRGGTGGSAPMDAAVPRDTTPPPPPSGCGFDNVVSKTLFDTIFPPGQRHSLYTYEGLAAAARAFPAFVGTGDANTCKKEAAAFLANVAHETGKLRYAEEINKNRYCSSRGDCPCDSGTSDQSRWYFGRGPIQLSWNYNYCAAGKVIGADLHAQPSLVSTNPEIAWKTALWFWMTQQGAGITTPHNAIVQGLGFGQTINSINGSIECFKGGYGQQQQVTLRVDYYLDFARRLGVTNVGSPQDNDC